MYEESLSRMIYFLWNTRPHHVFDEKKKAGVKCVCKCDKKKEKEWIEIFLR